MKKLSAFARNVRSLRRELGLTKDEFSKKMSISSSSLGNWERGETVPHVYQIEKILRIALDNGKKYEYEDLLDSSTLDQYSPDNK